ncbi:helix-turn-helix transcriptional regulator [Nocardia sp. NPDC050793]|uniref:helix-turn-helix domain-containing protein n=1 Tax=Nocardia sp. NPDC050793 TaxID=3155159 RepID=UPI0033FB5E41
MARRGLLNAALGVEIRARREAAGLTREQVCKAADTARNVLIRLEAGTRSMTVEQLEAIARALETDLNDIYQGARKRIESGQIRTRSERAADELRAAIGFD